MIKFYDSNGKYWGEYDEKRSLFIPSQDVVDDRKTESSSEIKVEPTWVGTTYGRFEDEPQTDCAWK